MSGGVVVMALPHSLSPGPRPSPASGAPDGRSRPPPRHRVGVGVEPVDPGVPPEPGPLALGEGPGPSDRLVHGLGQRHARPPRGRAAPGSRGPGGPSATARRVGRRACGPRRGTPRPAGGRTARRSGGPTPPAPAGCPGGRPGLGGYRSSPGPNEENGRPDPSVTSRARTRRRSLPGSIRAAAAGSSVASRAWSPAQPSGRAVAPRRAEGVQLGGQLGGHRRISPRERRSSVTARR